MTAANWTATLLHGLLLLAAAQALPARAFDSVSGADGARHGPVRHLLPLPHGISVEFRNGARLELLNVDHPRHGSPVTYRYMDFDTSLQAYVIDVWRVGRQPVLVSRASGAFVETGIHRLASPHKDLLFSSDCWETGCYYQLNAWPSGKRLLFSQFSGSSGARSSRNLPDAVTQMSWHKDGNLRFDMPCSAADLRVYSASVALVRQGAHWHLRPANPCAAS